MDRTIMKFKIVTLTYYFMRIIWYQCSYPSLLINFWESKGGVLEVRYRDIVSDFEKNKGKSGREDYWISGNGELFLISKNKEGLLEFRYRGNVSD